MCGGGGRQNHMSIVKRWIYSQKLLLTLHLSFVVCEYVHLRTVNILHLIMYSHSFKLICIWKFESWQQKSWGVINWTSCCKTNVTEIEIKMWNFRGENNWLKTVIFTWNLSCFIEDQVCIVWSFINGEHDPIYDAWLNSSIWWQCRRLLTGPVYFCISCVCDC